MFFNIVLSDDDISLIPITEYSFDDLYNVAKDPAIWEQHFDTQRYELDIFKEYFDTALQNEEGCFLVVCNNEVVGSTRYYEYSPDKSSVKIGYTFYAKEYWGTSLNNKVKNLMLDYAFEYIDNVYFDIWNKNYRSQKAIQKIGAKLMSKNSESNKYLYLLKKNDY